MFYDVCYQFRFATCGDVFLILLGIVCACINGVSLPAMIIVFGDMIDSFVGDGQAQEALAGIPWELTSYTQEQAMADPDILM